MIHQIRCFDVPLMVFVSGLSYSGKTLKASFLSYYIPRTLRLIIPVYIFLSVYFILFAVLGKSLPISTILGSYCLLQSPSIGYVWIIKVFLLIMLVTPLLLRLSHHISNWYFWILLISILFMNLAICHYAIPNINGPLLRLAVTEIIPYLMGYSVVFLLGLRIRSICPKEEKIYIIIILISSILIFIAHFVTERSLSLQASKYPPQAYFLIYGMLISTILWKLRSFKFINKVAENNLILFIGRNTIWIYLWHIVFVLFANKYIFNWGGGIYLSMYQHFVALSYNTSLYKN